MTKIVKWRLLLTAGAVFCLSFPAVPAKANPLTSPAGMQDGGLGIIYVQGGHGLSSEEREEFRNKLEEEKARIKKELENLPPEERAARKRELRHEFIRKRIEERLEKLPPEEREVARKKMEERRARIKAELEGLPPEERKQRMKELRREFKERRKQRWKESREKFKERWRNATPEQKQSFCAKAKERCAEGGKDRACEMVQTHCSQLQQEE